MTAAEATLPLLSPSLTPILHGAGEWQAQVLAVIRGLPPGTRLQACDIAASCPAPANGKAAWGAAFSAAARAGLLVCVGAEPSRRSTVRGSLTRVWERT